jgi:integrase
MLDDQPLPAAPAAQALAAPADSARLDELKSRSAAYAARSFGAGTRRAYRSAWTQYEDWCQARGLDPFAGTSGPLPLYVTDLAAQGRSVSTIRVALAAIAAAYRLADQDLDLQAPKLAAVLAGVTRSLGVRPRRQAKPADAGIIRAMLAQCSKDELFRAALCARDRAMLLLGFGAALRRSELVGLTIGDVEIVEGRGVMLTIARSKTDQQGAGDQIAIWRNQDDPGFCPARALATWLQHRRLAPDLEGEGAAARPLFCAVTKGGKLTGAGLSDKAVVRLVKEKAAAAGYDPGMFSGHSLRAGLITAAGDAGVELPPVMRQARHSDPRTTMRYMRPADLWRNNPTERLFRGG